jgi:hypothetical protein
MRACVRLRACKKWQLIKKCYDNPQEQRQEIQKKKKILNCVQ